MPPKIQYTKDQITDAAIEVVRKIGSESLNARAIAKQLGCSTQPIFREFENMAELKSAVLQRAGKIYGRYLTEHSKDAGKPYKAAGTAYIQFAEEEKQLFRLLFMRDRSAKEYDQRDETIEPYLDGISASLGITKKEAYDFHVRMWIYTHGMATMAATGYLVFTEEQVSELLTEEFLALKGALLHKNG